MSTFIAFQLLLTREPPLPSVGLKSPGALGQLSDKLSEQNQFITWHPISDKKRSNWKAIRSTITSRYRHNGQYYDLRDKLTETKQKSTVQKGKKVFTF